MTLSVTGWKMVGSTYRHGLKLPGFTLLYLSDGSTRYYRDDVAIGPALDRIQLEHGVDVTEARRQLQEWVETGRGVTFSLVEP